MSDRIVYFVLSHTNVPQVVRLIGRIRKDVPQSLVLVHHDATTEAFDRAAFRDDACVHVLDRSIHGEWAGFSLVEIVLYGLEDLAQRRVAYDWVVLLSGQDYPIGRLDAFERHVAASGDGLLESDSNPGTLLDRYRFSWLRFPRMLEHGALHRAIGFLARLNGRQPYLRFLSGRVGCRIGIASNRLPFATGTTVRKGTQWWALSVRAIARVREVVANDPAFVRHYREHTIMPDESFFHTILQNEKTFAFVNDDARFTRWAAANSASPEILREQDFASIASSGAHFARKFDDRIDAAILDRLDNM